VNGKVANNSISEGIHCCFKFAFKPAAIIHAVGFSPFAMAGFICQDKGNAVKILGKTVNRAN